MNKSELAAKRAMEAEAKERIRWTSARAWAEAHPECRKVISVQSEGFAWIDAQRNVHTHSWENYEPAVASTTAPARPPAGERTRARGASVPAPIAGATGAGRLHGRKP